MNRSICVALLFTTAIAGAAPVIAPPIRRVYVNSVGDVLEWQPGLGIVLVPKSAHVRTVTKIKRRAAADAKAIVPIERPAPPPQIPDEGEALMEEAEKAE